MSKKRRQRSTAIRKRVEKKHREEARARKKKQKLAAKLGEEYEVGQLRMTAPRPVLQACVATLADLNRRLAAGPIRGWTPSDLDEKYGLNWLSGLIQEAMEQQETHALVVDFREDAKDPLLNRLAALEVAAPGLSVDWERGGLAEVAFALGRAEEVEDEDDGEDDEG